MVVAVTMKFCD